MVFFSEERRGQVLAQTYSVSLFPQSNYGKGKRTPSDFFSLERGDTQSYSLTGPPVRSQAMWKTPHEDEHTFVGSLVLPTIIPSSLISATCNSSLPCCSLSTDSTDYVYHSVCLDIAMPSCTVGSMPRAGKTVWTDVTQ